MSPSAADESSAKATENAPAPGAKAQKETEPQGKPVAKGSDAAPAGETPKEAKLRKKAEAAARRAEKKLEMGKGGAPANGPATPNTPAVTGGPQNAAQRQRRGTNGAQDSVPPARGNAASNRPAREQAQGGRGQDTNAQNATARPNKAERSFRKDSAFSDIPARARPQISNASKEVHPAILTLGLQMADYSVCGSSARTVAMLQAFQAVVEDYTTPPGNSFARHFTGHHLAKQIDFLISCRPLAPPMGNAVRWLKALTIREDTDAIESDTRKRTVEEIDTFIKERFTAATALIADTAAGKINDGDVIATYAGSSTVKSALLRAHKEGKIFTVFVFNSKPLNEGETMAAALRHVGIDAETASLSNLARLVKRITKVFLGCTALTSNGCNYSRVGTSIVALTAHLQNVPVIVLAQTIKFIDRPLVSGFEMNENGPSEELLSMREFQAKSKQPTAEGMTGPEPSLSLDDKKGVKILNLMYDLTMSNRISLIICEYGQVHPHAVPAMLKMIKTKDQWDTVA